MHTSITQMEPMLPSTGSDKLNELAVELIRESSKLGNQLHPISQRAIIALVRNMNSYYSNLIEGHYTKPHDIDRALKGDYSKDPAKRVLQIESIAHVNVQSWLEKELRENPELNICSSEFICTLHRKFYEHLPEELLTIKSDDEKTTRRVVPGKLRDSEVKIGKHIPPAANELEKFMSRFEEVYNPNNKTDIEKIIAAAASHHRLAWIHPFLDGNGRVCRLFTYAYLIRAKASGHGMWTVSRGFARTRDNYFHALASADQPRQGDYDGRGNLSNKGLITFCEYFLTTAIDQVKFMNDQLNLTELRKHLNQYVTMQIHLGRMHEHAGKLLEHLLFYGEIKRGNVDEVIRQSDRTARRVIEELTSKSLITSDTPKGPIRLYFPAEMVIYLFPELYGMDILYR